MQPESPGYWFWATLAINFILWSLLDYIFQKPQRMVWQFFTALIPAAAVATGVYLRQQGY